MSDPSARAEARARLVAAVEGARAAGAPATGLAADLYTMSVDDAVTEVERRLRAALSRQESAKDTLDAMASAAEALDAIGLSEDGDRLLLVAAAALEGRELGPTMRDMEPVADMAASTVAEEVEGAREGAQPVGDFMSLALDTEGDAFADSFARAKLGAARRLGASVREGLVSEGRAVPVGWCRHCGDAVALDGDLRCAACGRRSKHADFVVPGEVAAARAFLRKR